MSSKLAEGDDKGAVRLACSRDTIAEHSTSNVEAIKMKHPSRQLILPLIEAQLHPTSLSFTIDANAVRRAIMSFPNGSSGGADGLLLQHLKVIIGPAAEDGALSVLNALTALITMILEGKTPAPIQPLFFGAKLTALKKESGRIRPIAVGGTISRLVSKCACLHALTQGPPSTPPIGIQSFGVCRGSCACNEDLFE